jgi:hypothetical protein
MANGAGRLKFVWNLREKRVRLHRSAANKATFQSQSPSRASTAQLWPPMPCKIPTSDQVGETTPLRLSVAAEIAFPDGSMSASGLRREATRGRLTIERIAGRFYTTLANIERMRGLCRVEAREPDSSCAKSARTQTETSPIARPGSSETEELTLSQAALKMKLEKLSDT